jgi:hypothetical protein
MGLFSFGSSLPVKKTLRLKRLKPKWWDVKIGQNLNVWFDKKNYLVNVYAIGQVGECLVAHIEDSKICNTLNKYDCYADTNVKYVDDKEIELEVHLHE